MKPPFLTFRRTAISTGSLAAILFIVGVVSLAIGSVTIPFSHVTDALLGKTAAIPSSELVILWQLRFPRVILAMMVGAALSVTGCVFQALFRNPLAEPYILGISSGGTVGTLIALVAGTAALIPAASFIGSLSVMVLVYTIGRRRGQLDTNILLLAGVMIGTFFNAIILLLISLYNQELRTSYLWLLGNLSNANTASLFIVIPVVLIGSMVFWSFGRQFNLIASGEDSATQLGVNVPRLKVISYILASMMIGIVVSVSGVIGFVGLVIPHICRILFGPDHRIVFPTSFLTGAIFLLLADLIARTILAPAEIPVGAITAVLGAPFFIWLLRK
ncbi:MAG: iron ABC transporter permease [Bacteroidota bacterium]